MQTTIGKQLNRDEQVLLKYFRALTVQQQMDILGAAEISYNAQERQRELASRSIERDFVEDYGGSPQH